MPGEVMNRRAKLPSRRDFISGATAAALAAGAETLRAADTPEPVRVAVIGTGGRGSDLLRSLTTIAGVQVAGICDDYPPHLARAAKYAGPQARTFSDYRQHAGRTCGRRPW